jgi:hypothetical protein
VRESGILSRAAICRIFGIDAAQITTDHVEFDPALAIKFTIYRPMPNGSPGDAQTANRGSVGRVGGYLDIPENLIAGAEPGGSSHLTLCWREVDSNCRSLRDWDRSPRR